jgi:hypothetical protein
LKSIADAIDQEPSDIIWQIVASEHPNNDSGDQQVQWDVFVSHASEDKDGFVRPLAEALRSEGLTVWYATYQRSF